MVGFTGAVDLSNLGKPQPEPAPQPQTLTEDAIFECTVDGGCGLTIRKGSTREHESLADCLNTCLPYVGTFLQLEIQYMQVITATENLFAQNDTLVAANQRLVAERDAARREVSTLRSQVIAARREIPDEPPPAAS